MPLPHGLSVVGCLVFVSGPSDWPSVHPSKAPDARLASGSAQSTPPRRRRRCAVGARSHR